MEALLSLLFCGVMSATAIAKDEAPKEGPVKVEQAEKQLAEGTQLLDVRTKDEWDEGHLKGAKLATVTEDGFLAKAKAALDPKKPVLVYCRSGKRSAAAAKELRKAGFSPVYELDGGTMAWAKAGKPQVKD